MLVLTYLIVILIVGAIAFYIAGSFFTWQFFRQPEEFSPETLTVTPSTSEASVAILVPIRGIDAGAWENWSSLCTQNYSNYQVYFGIMDPTDPAVPIVEQIVATYPDRAQLITNLPPRGPNHKDSNVTYLLDHIAKSGAKTQAPERIIFTDSDIYAEPNYIHRVTAPLNDPTIGMVTCSYLARRPRHLGAAFAALARCCDFTPSLLIARQLDGGVKLGIGVTMAVTPAALQAAGGIYCNRIGSDYNLGKRIAQAGYRIELSRHILESDTGTETLREVWQRELRWSRTIRFNKGPIYYAQIFCFGTIFAPLLILLTHGAPWSIALLLFTYLTRYLQATIATHYQQAPRLRRWFWALPLRDLMSFALWLIGGYGRTIYWRGRQLQIQGDGIISERQETRS